MKSAVIVFPGSNCDRDIAVALEDVTDRKPAMVWHRDSELLFLLFSEWTVRVDHLADQRKNVYWCAADRDLVRFGHGIRQKLVDLFDQLPARFTD